MSPNALAFSTQFNQNQYVCPGRQQGRRAEEPLHQEPRHTARIVELARRHGLVTNAGRSPVALVR